MGYYGVVSLPFLLLQFFAEFIFRLVKDKFTELAGSRLSAPNSRHKVLAGIVMTRGEKERRRRHSCYSFLPEQHQQILPCDSKQPKQNRDEREEVTSNGPADLEGRQSHLHLSVNL